MSIDPVQAAVAFAPSSGHAEVASEHPRQAQRAVQTAAPVAAAPAPLPQARSIQVSASFGNGHLVIYRILDRQTGELIEQIPPEQFLEAARNTQEPSESEAPNQKVNLQF